MYQFPITLCTERYLWCIRSQMYVHSLINHRYKLLVNVFVATSLGWKIELSSDKHTRWETK